MKLQGLSAGTRLVTVSGDIVELLSVTSDGSGARVRYIEVLGGAEAGVGTEADVSADDIATVEGTRFVGPPRTLSSNGQ